MSFRACRVLAVLAAWMTFHAAPAVGQDFEGVNVSAVDFRYEGPQTVDEARLRNFIQLSAGAPYRTDKIDTDIKALYESGLVDDVRVLAEPQGESVRVVYAVVTRPAFVGVGFVGNSIFSDTKLARESKLKAGGALSDEMILDARLNLERLYEEGGYPDVRISHRFQESLTGGGAELIFVIDEGQKNEIRDIKFEGNSVFDDRTLRRQMSVKEKGLLSFLTKSGRFEVDQLDQDLESVLDYYRTRGYLRASSPGIRREPVGDGRVDLVVPITEGEKYTVRGVGFGKMSVFTEEELYPAMTLQGGDAYNSKKMRADITTIRSFYGSRGYADAAVTPDIRDAGPTQVDVVYRVTEGSRYKVGSVNIQGNTKTQDRVIRREVPLKPGDHFNSVELETTKARLQGLQYFGNVEVAGTPSARGGNYRDVDILVEERRTGTISAGVGFSAIDNVVGFLSVEQANFDIRNPWSFTGGGQRFAFNLRLGDVRQDVNISLTEPWFLGQQLALTGELFYQNAQFFSNVFDQSNAGAAVSLRKPLGERTAVRAEYRIEEIGIDVDAPFSDPASGSEFAQFDGDFLRSAVSGGWIYDSRDGVIETREGSLVNLGAHFAGLGGDGENYGISLRGQKWWNWKWDTIFTVHGELASVDALSDQVPLFDRLFLGGPRTLRGFQFRDVGPRDPVSGEVFGGQSLGYVTLEGSVPIIDNVRIAAFWDGGFVNADAWNPLPEDFYHNVGVGVRLKLPISPVPIALDYGIPLSSPDAQADEGGQFNFYLGFQY